MKVDVFVDFFKVSQDKLLAISITPSYSKFFFHATAVVVLVQAIYFYNSLVGWIHLPLFVLFMMVVDVYKFERRDLKLEMLTLLSFSLLAVITIFMGKIGSVGLYIANMLLLVICLQCILLIYKTFSLFRSDEEFSFINDANKKIANKKIFMTTFLIIVQVCLVCVAALVVLRIIKS